MFFLSRFFQIDCGTTIHRAYGSFPSLEVTVVATSQCLTEQVTKTFEPARCSSCLQKGKRNRHCLAIVSSLSSLPGLVGTGLSSFMPEFFHVKNYGLPRSIDVLEDRVHAFGMFALNLCGGLRFTTTGTKTKEV